MQQAGTSACRYPAGVFLERSNFASRDPPAAGTVSTASRNLPRNLERESALHGVTVRREASPFNRVSTVRQHRRRRAEAGYRSHVVRTVELESIPSLVCQTNHRDAHRCIECDRHHIRILSRPCVRARSTVPANQILTSSTPAMFIWTFQFFTVVLPVGGMSIRTPTLDPSESCPGHVTRRTSVR